MTVENDRGHAEFSPFPNPLNQRSIRQAAMDAEISLEAGLASNLDMPKKAIFLNFRKTPAIIKNATLRYDR